MFVLLMGIYSRDHGLSLLGLLFHVLTLIFSEHEFILLIVPSLGELWHRCQQPPETAKSFCAVKMRSVHASS